MGVVCFLGSGLVCVMVQGVDKGCVVGWFLFWVWYWFMVYDNTRVRLVFMISQGPIL